MTPMTEEQAIRAMETLCRLYADQYGIENPVITVRKKSETVEEEVKEAIVV